MGNIMDVSAFDQEVINNEDYLKLIRDLGAQPISKVNNLPDFSVFKKGLFFSHRDFDKFIAAAKRGEKVAIVSGFNASGKMHLGHTIVFETVKLLQNLFDCDLIIPISDDESYLTGKVKSQEEALKNALGIAEQISGFGFNTTRTKIIIDQLYPEIYNLAVKYSRFSTMSTVKAVYGYSNEINPGVFFYPFVQTAHILYPIEKLNAKYVLVPIAVDEDSHLRLCRDVAAKLGFPKPAVIHSKFINGLDGKKMSKSKPNSAIFLDDSDSIIKKKVNLAITGGQHTIEEQRKLGGDPEKCAVIKYLGDLFLDVDAVNELKEKYKKGKVLDKENKELLYNEIIKYTKNLKQNIKLSGQDFDKMILH